VHPERAIAGIDFTTGSLGHGLAYAVGAALAARMQESSRRAFALLSDAECNEGSVWESVMFAAHHGLTNVVAIIDANGQQALGYTRDVLDLSPLAARFDAFGWQVASIDGHDSAQLFDAFTRPTARPQVVVANTVFGHGVSFMERQIAWHYLPMSDMQYSEALRELEQQACADPSSVS